MKSEMTWRQAIEEVLKGSSEPMHYRDITSQIVERKLRIHLGATPDSTVSANLTTAIRVDGAGCPFEKIGRGMYRWRTLSVPAALAPSESRLEPPDREEQYEIITSFGMFWRREGVDWQSKPRLFGKQRMGAGSVDFAEQRGIYLLYDGREIVYAGRTTDRSLGVRLYEHTRDRLAARWNRFSWFGLLPISEKGALGEMPSEYASAMVIPALEAVLIEALEPRQNRKRGDDLSAVEYIQEVDPTVRKRTLKAAIDELS